jgi:hypothetical protein
MEEKKYQPEQSHSRTLISDHAQTKLFSQYLFSEAKRSEKTGLTYL